MVAGLVLTGCASASKTYPSLAIRDAERFSGSFGVASAPEPLRPAPLSSDTAQRLLQIKAAARASHKEFQAATAGTRRAVAAGAGSAVTTDRWANATVALSNLDSLRSLTSAGLSDLDLLFVDTTLAFEQREEVAAVRDEVTALVLQQDNTLAELRARFSQ